MTAILNLADVPIVAASDLYDPMRRLIAQGHGLALLKGLTEQRIRALEDEFWLDFDGSPETRLAVALRFRALLHVFTDRRLKGVLLANGFKTIAAAVMEASTQRLNARLGFKAQAFVMALDRGLRPARRQTAERPHLAIAA